MATLTQIRAGLAARLATISGLNTHYVWPSTVTPPAAIILPRSGQYNLTIGGNDTLWSFDITIVVKLGQFEAGQDALDAYLDSSGASSVAAAIRADPTLGGVADDVMRVEFVEYADRPMKGVNYMTAIIGVDVWAT